MPTARDEAVNVGITAALSKHSALRQMLHGKKRSRTNSTGESIRDPLQSEHPFLRHVTEHFDTLELH